MRLRRREGKRGEEGGKATAPAVPLSVPLVLLTFAVVVVLLLLLVQLWLLLLWQLLPLSLPLAVFG